MHDISDINIDLQMMLVDTLQSEKNRFSIYVPYVAGVGPGNLFILRKEV